MSLSSAAKASALDFQGFAALRQVSRERAEEGATLVARQFEGIILQTMLRTMRQGLPGDPLLSSAGSKMYRDLFDQQLALRLSESKSVGIADLLLEQLRRSGALGGEAAGTSGAQGTGAAEGLPAGVPRRGLFPSVSGRPEERVSGGVEEPAGPVRSPVLPDPPQTGTQEDFIRAVRPHAVLAAREIGVDPDVLVAQAALESGWGRSTMRRADGSNAHNLFGIKATPSWRGDVVTVPTLEYEGGVAVRRQAAFRAYGSYAESFQDYAALVRDNPRYARAVEFASDPRAYMRELQAAGYATDPAYADKVLGIWQSKLAGLRSARA